jgi:flagellar basal body rod protein FlgG
MSTYGLWLSASGMQINEYRQSVLANNLANAQTTGFKEDLAIASQRTVASREGAGGMAMRHPVLDGMTGGAAAMPTYHSFAQGTLEQTNNPLDWAVDGDGFFTVSDGAQTRYTRDGVMTVNQAGELVLAAGSGRWRMVDSAGVPIVTQPGGGAVRVSSDGTVRQGANAIGQVSLVTAPDKTQLKKAGENLFTIENPVQMVPATGQIAAGSRELSNFDTMKGLAGMIEASRAYQMNATLIQLQDQAAGHAISRVGRVA